MVVVFLCEARKRAGTLPHATRCGGNGGFGQGWSARLARPFTTTVIGGASGQAADGRAISGWFMRRSFEGEVQGQV
jgi:hypothetical protein